MSLCPKSCRQVLSGLGPYYNKHALKGIESLSLSLNFFCLQKLDCRFTLDASQLFVVTYLKRLKLLIINVSLVCGYLLDVSL